MNELIAILFVIALFFLSIAGEEFERTDTWQTYFEREIEIQDSIWNEIQRINWEKIAKSAMEEMNLKEGIWELIRYEGNCLMGIDYGDSIMVRRK